MTAIKCFFLDVGQGCSHIITFGSKRAIVIDCGPENASIVLNSLLKDRGVESIEALILSHNDKDHSFAAPEVIEKYIRKDMGKIFFLVDRGPNLPQNNSFNKFISFLLEKIELGELDKKQLIRLETSEIPKKIFEDCDQGISVELHYPGILDNLISLQKKSPNKTSAILSLVINRHRKVLFTGDAPYKVLKKFNDLQTEIITVPHHGAHMGCSKQELTRFYDKHVSAKYAVISVGTENHYRHPSFEVVQSIIKNGTVVMCTQVTPSCCEKLENWRKMRGDNIGLSDSRGQYRKQIKIACHGTVVAEFNGENTTIRDLEKIQAIKENLFKEVRCSPMCQYDPNGTDK